MTLNLKGRRILVTGSVGFIGFHAASLLLQSGAEVLGIDNFAPYYDVSLLAPDLQSGRGGHKAES